jgi:hypothetical protein
MTVTLPAGEPSALIERLIRIETKLDVSNTTQLDHEGRIRSLEIDNTPGGHQDHEARLRRIEDEVPPGSRKDLEIRVRRNERALWIIAGAAAAGGGIIGSILGPLINT